jgi:hypothetical protein
MYPILEYSSQYLILEYFAYFHTYTVYVYPVFVLPIYMYILTVSVYTILIHTYTINVIIICIVNTLRVCVSHLLCIHPSMIHICSHAEVLVMTEHNFFVNHVR